MRRRRVPLGPSLIVLAALAFVPPRVAGADPCGCGATGPFVGGGYSQLHNSNPAYDVTVTGGGSFWTVTVIGANDTLRVDLPAQPEWIYFNDRGNRLQFHYTNGGVDYCDVYALDRRHYPLLVEVSGTGVTSFNFSLAGNFMTYSQQFPGQVENHVLRVDNGAEVYAYTAPNPAGPPNVVGLPIFAPDDHSFYYQYRDTNPQDLYVVSLDTQGLVFHGTDWVEFQPLFTPCGDAIAALHTNGSPPLQIDLHGTFDGGAEGSTSLPSGATSYQLLTTPTQQVFRYQDAGGSHDVVLSDNIAAQACPFTAQPASLTATPETVEGGNPVTIHVQLSHPAPIGGLWVDVQSNNPNVLNGSAYVPWGSDTGSVVIPTKPITSFTQPATVYVYGTVPLVSVQIAVNPPAPHLLNLWTATTLPAGQPCQFSIGLSGPALGAGASVALTSSDPATLPLPPTTLIAPAAYWSSFDVPTPASLADHTVEVSASYAGTTLNATIQVQGPRPGPLTATNTCVIGGQPIHARLAMSAIAPASGLDLSVNSTDSSHVTLPGALHLAPGASSLEFDVPTLPTAGPIALDLAVSFNGVDAVCPVEIDPPQPWWVDYVPAVIAGETSPWNTANAIDPQGVVVGACDLGRDSYQDVAYSWQPGALRTLPGLDLGSPWSAEAFATNGSGVIVGEYGPDAFRCDGTTVVDLTPDHGGGALGVNPLGHVVGRAGDVSGNSQAFFHDGTLHVLGTLGGANSAATGINPGDVVVGWSEMADGSTHAFRWTAAGGMQDLGLPDGTQNAWATAINRAGVIVGYANDGSSDHACLWDGTGPHLLDSASSRALALNDANQVVGWADHDAILWDGPDRTVLDAPTGACSLADIAGTNILVATGINDAGQVCGNAYDNEGRPNGTPARLQPGAARATADFRSYVFAWTLTLANAPVVTGVPPVTSPSIARTLELAVVGANPVRGRLALRCALPDAGAATLELLDVTGRRVATRELPGDAAFHVVQVPETESAPPGVYFARLTQAGQVRLARVTVLR